MIGIALALWLAPMLATCHANGLLPDKQCTPGVADPSVTLQELCTTSTRTRRHTSEALKRHILAEYGVAWADRDAYEVDHLVPLCVAGADTALDLWAEPIADAKRKDLVEDAAKRAVCAGKMKLEDVQKAFAEDWTAIKLP